MSDLLKTGSTFSQALSDVVSEFFSRLIPECLEAQKNLSSRSVADISGVVQSFGHSNFTIGFEGTKESLPEADWPPTDVSDLGAIIGNHLRSIFSIGKVCGVSDDLCDGDLALGILLQSVGEPDGWRILSLQGETLSLARPGPQKLPLLISGYAAAIGREFGRVRTLQSFPECAPAIMASWGFLSTSEIGRMARNLFSRKIQVRSGGGAGMVPAGMASQENDQACDVEKVKILVNLLKADHVVEDRKAAAISPFLKALSLAPEEMHRIEKRIVNTKPLAVDYEPFQREPWRKIDMLMDLIGLACEDQKLNLVKTQFVRDVGQAVGFSREEMEWLMEEEARANAFRGRALIP